MHTFRISSPSAGPAEPAWLVRAVWGPRRFGAPAMRPPRGSRGSGDRVPARAARPYDARRARHAAAAPAPPKRRSGPPRMRARARPARRRPDSRTGERRRPGPFLRGTGAPPSFLPRGGHPPERRPQVPAPGRMRYGARPTRRTPACPRPRPSPCPPPTPRTCVWPICCARRAARARSCSRGSSGGHP